MNADSQLVDIVVADFVSGNLTESASVLIESHLEISPANREWAKNLESAHGIGLSEGEAVVLSDGPKVLEDILSDEAPSWLSEWDEVDEDASADDVLPKPLKKHIGKSVDDISWRRVLPGLKEAKVDFGDGIDAKLLWIKAGLAMPTHTHHGSEMTLVLQGAFSDSSGRYGRGDIAIADEEVDHRPIAEPGEDCICFVVCDAPLELTGPIGRWFAPFMRKPKS